MAAAWDLPIVYIIENNLYGITVDTRRVTKEHDLAKRAIGYGIPGYTIDGNDIEQVYETVGKAVKDAREGKGPAIVECKTYRHHGHNGSDMSMMHDFVRMVGEGRKGKTDAAVSVESHLMALAAEEARITGQVVNLRGFANENK